MLFKDNSLTNSTILKFLILHLQCFPLHDYFYDCTNKIHLIKTGLLMGTELSKKIYLFKLFQRCKNTRRSFEILKNVMLNNTIKKKSNINNVKM